MRVRGYAAATPCWAVHYSLNTAATVEFNSGLFGWTTATKNGAAVFLLRDLAVAGRAEITDDAGTPSHWRTILWSRLRRGREVYARTGRASAAYLADPTGGTFLVIEPLPS